MSDEQAAQAVKEAAEKAEAAKVSTDPTEIAKQIATLNQESAAKRIENKELREKLEKFEAAQAEAAEKAAAEKGEFKELYEKLKADSESKDSRVTAMAETLTKMLEAETANIPEEYRALIPTGDVTTALEWIATAKTAKLFEPKGGPGFRPAGESQAGTLEAELAAAKESGDILAQVHIKKQIFDKSQRSN